MSRHNEYDADEAQKREDEPAEFSSGEEDDDELREDMEALRQACMRTGADLTDLHNAAAPSGTHENRSSHGGRVSAATDSDSEDDLELFRSIRSRFELSNEECEPLSTKPLRILPPVDFDDDEDEKDDFETLRAIQRRFSAYAAMDNQQKAKEACFGHKQQFEASGMNLEDTALDSLINDPSERLKSFDESCITTDLPSDSGEIQLSDLSQWDQSDASKSLPSQPQEPGFPDSAQDFVVAIRRNRAYQKFLRSKLTHIEAKIEENKKLKERIKLLRDFQVSCRRNTGRGLTLRKDPRVQLISSLRCRTSKGEEVNDKVTALQSAPPENSHVANYRSALKKFPLELHRNKWSNEERENLRKGVRQQIQEMELHDLMESSPGISHGGQRNLDGILSSIKNLEITPESIRARIPQVDWDQLSSMYVDGHSGAECAAWWLNHEDPLINHSSWTAEEDKKLLSIVQKEGITDLCSVAACLGTNRTPYQCLVRYQRSLNADMLNREWTKEEDDQLCSAVETYGECAWQSVASTLEKRSGVQCAERWKKSLIPTTKGKWTLDESKRLKVAVAFFGPKCWNKIAQFVPGRGQAQCRERWVNVLNPSLSSTKWSEREDSMLEVAIEEHGYHWSRVAACIPPRTDNECWRRWKALHPGEAAKLAAARKQVKKLIPSNFVDRESERPALDPIDMIELPMLNSMSEQNTAKQQRKQKRKPRKQPEKGKENETTLCVLAAQRSESVTQMNNLQILPGEVQGTTGGIEAEARADLENESFVGHDNVKKGRKPSSRRTRYKMDTRVTKKCSVKTPAGAAGKPDDIGEHDATRKKNRKGSSGKRRHRTLNIGVPNYYGEDQRIIDGNEALDFSEHVCIKKKTKGLGSDKSIPHVPRKGAIISTLEVQVEINGDQAEASSEHDASRRKRKRRSTKNSSSLKPGKDRIFPTSMSPISTNGKENDCFTSGDVLESKRSPRNARKKLHNRPYRYFGSDMCSVNSLQSGTTEDADMMHDSGVSGTRNSEEVGALGQDDSFRRKRAKIQSRRICTNRIVNVEGVGNISMNADTSDNKLSDDEVEDEMSLACFMRNQLKKRRLHTSGNTNISMTDDDMKLVHFLRNKSNRRHQNLANGDSRNLACSVPSKSKRKKHHGIENGENRKPTCFHNKKLKKNQQMVENVNLSAADDENMKLAGFLQRRLKVSRHEHHRDAHPSSITRHKTKKTRPSLSPSKAETRSGCVNPVNTIQACSSNVDIPESASGPASKSTGKESHLEADDVPLSSLRRMSKRIQSKRQVRASVERVR